MIYLNGMHGGSGSSPLGSIDFLRISKGSGTNLSAAIFGDFSDLYVGTWGEMEILVDQLSDFAKGSTAVRVLQSLDIAVAHAQSFAAIKDINA